MTLDELNNASETVARESLKQCCGSEAWVERMLALGPFADRSALLSAADSAWGSLTAADWLEAFAQHPKIGERSAARWSSEEQRGMERASLTTAAAMNQLNIEYERKFGWIFIVCASGKSAEEMLSLLAARLKNEPADELPIAAAEQAKITRLRLEKLLNT
jgi:2-oxo-4-hydroxy-4-carboxy-5-ureidoimidazoline decarboxylase